MTTQTAPATFQAGDRILCADGVARTVRAMAPLTAGEPVRVVVEDGTEWAALTCRRANQEDLAAARLLASASAARVRLADPDAPQWRAALADLGAAEDYLKDADPDPRVRAAMAEGEASAARTLAEIGMQTAAVETPEETALREELAALFTALAGDRNAHCFQPVHLRGADHPAAWTYRTGYGSAARYGWITARTGEQCTAPVEYRWRAEEAAVTAVKAEDRAAASPAFAFTAMSPADLRVALDHFRDRAARTRGTAPRYVLDDNVAAALKVLDAATFAEVPDGFTPESMEDVDVDVTGLVVQPLAATGVTAYWVENGRHVALSGRPHTAQLRSIRRMFEEAGWSLAPGSGCAVSAYRPTT
ncbi:hypothetical protein [Streptomyces sp. SM8]|uniref:hypothetical protein n=1 Tax=Streptomyces sp. SM8 TaxID=1195457 RepID=UPI0002830E7A|nr:hypothetical protein [Streptomyces sp. SM8]PKA32805.1 hypothetical protein SM8_032470 [Streptomyces sp. SM8]